MSQLNSTESGLVMARAVIADDHPLFRAALKQALGETLDAPILEVASFEQLLELIRREPQIELVLLDLTMPGNRGLTGLTSYAAEYLVVIVWPMNSADNSTATRR